MLPPPEPRASPAASPKGAGPPGSAWLQPQGSRVRDGRRAMLLRPPQPCRPGLSGGINNHGKNEKEPAVKVIPNWISRQLSLSTSASDLLKRDPEEH